MVSNKNFTFLDIRQGLLFVAINVVIAIISLGYIGIWGFHNENLQAGFTVIIFGFLLLVSLVGLLINVIFSMIKSEKGERFWFDSWTIPCGLFFVGFFIQSMIVYFGDTTTKSLLSIGKNNLLATFTASMPRFAEFFINALMVPVIEELFFIFFIPQVVVWIMEAIALKVDLFSNKVFQLMMAILVSGLLFATFHVGNQNLNFILAALIFRTLTILAVWGDIFFDWFKWAVIGISFTIGFHQGNNWMQYGFFNGLGIMTSSIWGWAYLFLLAIMFLFGPVEIVLRWFGIGKTIG